jgi:dTDP-4-amino-4,6-dideoxygalactose transaminase
LPPIYVTKPYLPPLSELLPLLEEIWESKVVTNNGPFHQRLEARLQDFLSVPHVSLMTNGMLALTTVMEAAAIEGEVITTPYSFVATTHSVKLGRLTPVFVDIKPDDLNIDPARIEAAITPKTSAIVAVHCYGNPCNVEAIEAIADRHGLTVIYDASHAFGVRYKGRGLLSWGDYATLSFHATKAFNTFEGGATITNSAERKTDVERIRNFGITDEVTVPVVGTNAKMSEFNAALGLVQLDHFEHVRRERARVDRLYRTLLADIPGLQPLVIPADVEPNHSYFPVLVGPDFRTGRDGLFEELKADDVYSRRYFYPLLSSLPMYRDCASSAPANLPVATRAADQIMCLPIYPDLTDGEVERIAGLVRGVSAVKARRAAR